MTLIKCVTAYTALLALSSQTMPYDTALAFVLLKKRLAPHVEFFSEKERELVETYAKRDADGNVVMESPGKFVLDPEKNIGEYNTRRRELSTIEVPEAFELITVTCPDKISPAHIEALEGFIDFKEQNK